MDARSWNSLLQSLPEPHILQTWEWGQVKAAFGWTPSYHVWEERSPGKLIYVAGQPQESTIAYAMALVLKRRLIVRGSDMGFNVIYVPKGPILRDWSERDMRQQVLSDLLIYARQQNAIFIKIDPDVRLGCGIPGRPEAREDPRGASLTTYLKQSGWIYSADQIQFPNSVYIDLNVPEETLLSNMKQKTRYNIRLAEKHNVSIRQGGESDIPDLYRMYAITSQRDGFVIRPLEYYESVWKLCMQAGFARPLIAEVNGEPVAAVILFWLSRQAWYLYGMSLDTHREKMPNYLLQWEAIRLAKANGCQRYDLWGAPDVFDENDSLWGVYRFKEGLGGYVVRNIGAWDYPIRPHWYELYMDIMPRILAWMRSRGKSKIKKSAMRDI